MKIDPIIAVSNVQASSKWYQAVFDCSSKHGGNQFDVLVDKQGEVLICLHKWGEHEHPTMKNPELASGNGFILYFRTENIEAIRKNLDDMGHPLESELELNPNSHKKEFSLRDPDGYYVTVSEYHNF